MTTRDDARFTALYAVEVTDTLVGVVEGARPGLVDVYLGRLSSGFLRHTATLTDAEHRAAAYYRLRFEE
jgi:hypothetical protein